MENYNISNSQISASSYAGAVHAASNGRLNFDPDNILIAGSWSAAVSDFDQPWLQVDFLEKVTTAKVATQGRLLDSKRYFQWVKTYSLNYSQDGIDFEAYEQFGSVKVIILNRHSLLLAVILESHPCRSCFQNVYLPVLQKCSKPVSIIIRNSTIGCPSYCTSSTQR